VVECTSLSTGRGASAGVLLRKFESRAFTACVELRSNTYRKQCIFAYSLDASVTMFRDSCFCPRTTLTGILRPTCSPSRLYTCAVCVTDAESISINTSPGFIPPLCAGDDSATCSRGARHESLRCSARKHAEKHHKEEAARLLRA
jgi:hypothetical protein